MQISFVHFPPRRNFMKALFYRLHKALVLAFVARYVKSVQIYYKKDRHVSNVIVLACDVDRFVAEKIKLRSERPTASEIERIDSVPLMAGGSGGVWFNKPELEEVARLDFEPRDGTTLWRA